MTKDHILKEIQRTAKELGGKAPGSHRFKSETGINRYDWLGVYWAQWSDALQEAGFLRTNSRRHLKKRSSSTSTPNLLLN